MKRRAFIAVAGGAAAWPLAARAQQPGGIRRIGVLMAYAESDPEGQAWIAAFREGLLKFGWAEGRNIRIDYGWAPADAESRRQIAKELVAQQPDLILTQNTPTTEAVLHQTRTIPIIFANVSDPVGRGFVASFSRPGGNVTGFVIRGSLGGKWLELLKEIAPRINRVAFLFNPSTAPYAEYFLSPFKAAAPSFAVEAIRAPVRDVSELESVVAAQAREPNGGLIVMPETFRTPIVPRSIAGGSLPSPCGLSISFLHRTRRPTVLRIDRSIIFGARRPMSIASSRAKSLRLPVQAPTKYEMVDQPQDRKGARPNVPPSLLAARRRGDRMKRRGFLGALGSAAVAWPLAAAPKTERTRLISVLMTFAEADPEGQARLAAFQTTFRELGWIDGQNSRIVVRWAAGDMERTQRFAMELIALRPDVAVVMSAPALVVMRRETRTVPIVFVQVSDPVGSGFVTSMSRPGANITGYANFETSMASKWIELLKEVAPHVGRIAFLIHAGLVPHLAFWRAAQNAAPSFGVQLTAAGSTQSQRSGARHRYFCRREKWRIDRITRSPL